MFTAVSLCDIGDFTALKNVIMQLSGIIILDIQNKADQVGYFISNIQNTYFGIKNNILGIRNRPLNLDIKNVFRYLHY